jgi:signal peptidase I
MGEPTDKEKPPSMMMRRLLRLLLALPGGYPLVAFLLGRRVVIRGWSMYPTLSPGEYVLFDRFAYRRRAPRRGDIVLATHPTRPNMRIVKRLAALPGDLVAIDGERCWVNGSPYGERRLAGPAEPSPSARTSTLGDDEYLLLGDAPHASTDARDFGPVGRRLLHARAWMVYWPPGKVRTIKGRRRNERFRAEV